MLLSGILNVSMGVVMSQKITRDIYAAKLKKISYKDIQRKSFSF